MSTFNQGTYQSGDGNLSEPITVGRLGQPVRFGGGTDWYSKGSSESISDRPLASVFGRGEWTVGNTVYISNGYGWRNASGERSTSLRIATFGDSTADLGTGTLYPSQDLSYVTSAFPVSGATTISYSSYRAFVNYFYKKAHLVFAGGISGQTTTQMLARDSLTPSITRRSITDALNLYPDVVILRGGSINDIANGTSITMPGLIATAYENHVTIINRFNSAGVKVIDEGIFAYDVPGSSLSVVHDAIITLNQMFRDYAETTNGQTVFLSADNIITNGRGSYLTNMSPDNVHPNTNASYLLAQLEANVLRSIFGEESGTRYPGVNLISNSLFDAFSTVAQGDIATGIVISPSKATATGGKIEKIDDKIFQTIIITPTDVGNVTTVAIPFTPQDYGIVANDIFGAEVDILVQGINGADAPTITNMYSRNDVSKTGAGRVINSTLAGSALPATIPGIDGIKAHLVFQPFQITEPSANLAVASTWPFVIGTDSLLPFKIGVSSPRFVKLGNAVLTT